MGALTRLVEGAIQRNIIPMGRPETQKGYPKTAKFSRVVRDAVMSPDSVDVIADGDDVEVDDEVGGYKDITIMPKQRGGQFELSESISALALGILLDPQREDQELWTKIEAVIRRG